jgi:hypothetical protein
MEKWLTIVGTLASLLGAGIAIWQSVKAKASANEAERIKNQIFGYRATSELSQLQAGCKKAQNSMSKYGPGSPSSSLKGVEPENDARDVQEFLLLVKEYREYFKERRRNQADSLCDAINPLLKDFSDETNPQKQKDLGTQILFLVSDFTSVIKKLVDSKIQKIA